MSVTLPDELDTAAVREFLDRVAVEIAESGEPITAETVEAHLRKRLERDAEMFTDPAIRERLAAYFFEQLGGRA